MTTPYPCFMCAFSSTDEDDYDSHLEARHGIPAASPSWKEDIEQMKLAASCGLPAMLMNLWRERVMLEGGEYLIAPFSANMDRAELMLYGTYPEAWVDGDEGAVIVRLDR